MLQRLHFKLFKKLSLYPFRMSSPLKHKIHSEIWNPYPEICQKRGPVWRFDGKERGWKMFYDNFFWLALLASIIELKVKYL